MVAAKGGGTLIDLQLHKMGKVRFRDLFRNRSKENYIQFEIPKQVSSPRSKHRNEDGKRKQDRDPTPGETHDPELGSFLKSSQRVLLTILAEEAIGEAEFAGALIRISPAVVGE